jgi:hypothetical protein
MSFWFSAPTSPLPARLLLLLFFPGQPELLPAAGGGDGGGGGSGRCCGGGGGGGLHVQHLHDHVFCARLPHVNLHAQLLQAADALVAIV